MSIFRSKKKIRTPEELVKAHYPEVANRVVGSKRSKVNQNYSYVFLDDFTLPNFVACVETGRVEPISEGESARTCLLRNATIAA